MTLQEEGGIHRLTVLRSQRLYGALLAAPLVAFARPAVGCPGNEPIYNQRIHNQSTQLTATAWRRVHPPQAAPAGRVASPQSPPARPGRWASRRRGKQQSLRQEVLAAAAAAAREEGSAESSIRLLATPCPAGCLPLTRRELGEEILVHSARHDDVGMFCTQRAAAGSRHSGRCDTYRPEKAYTASSWQRHSAAPRCREQLAFPPANSSR